MCAKQCSHCNDGHGHQQKYYNYSYFSLSDAELLEYLKCFVILCIRVKKFLESVQVFTVLRTEFMQYRYECCNTKQLI